MITNQMTFKIDNYNDTCNFRVEGYIDANNIYQMLNEFLRSCNGCFDKDSSFEDFCNKVVNLSESGLGRCDVYKDDNPSDDQVDTLVKAVLLEDDINLFLKDLRETQFYKEIIESLYIDYKDNRDIYFSAKRKYTSLEESEVTALEKRHGVGLCNIAILDREARQRIKMIME